MSDDMELVVHRDPETTPAQERLMTISKEIRDVLAEHGYPAEEAHAKMADFKAAVLDLMREDMRTTRRVPVELERWWRRGRRLAWLRGHDKAEDKVYRASMRQTSWARVLRKPRKVIPREQ